MVYQKIIYNQFSTISTARGFDDWPVVYAINGSRCVQDEYRISSASSFSQAFHVPMLVDYLLPSFLYVLSILSRSLKKNPPAGIGNLINEQWDQVYRISSV